MTDTTKTEAMRLLAALNDSIVLSMLSIATGSQREQQHAGERMGLAFNAVEGELRRLSAVEAERDHYKARCEALTDDALSRVMDASEDELNAALKLEGKDPDDTARLAGQAIDLALLTAERDRLATECEALRAALSAILKSPTGCQFCDYGKPRLSLRTGSPCEHDEGCGFVLAHAAMGGKGSQGGNGSGQGGK